MKNLIILVGLPLIIGACASSTKQNNAMLEKYPACYHQNLKLSNACIKKNEAGETVTALQLENAAFPGQYK